MINLYEDGKTNREIAQSVKMSLRDIGVILREYNYEPEPKPEKSDHTKAFQLFSVGKTPIQYPLSWIYLMKL